MLHFSKLAIKSDVNFFATQCKCKFSTNKKAFLQYLKKKSAQKLNFQKHFHSVSACRSAHPQISYLCSALSMLPCLRAILFNPSPLMFSVSPFRQPECVSNLFQCHGMAPSNSIITIRNLVLFASSQIPFQSILAQVGA